MKNMKTKKPIACGTDFSATAVEAVDIAAALARKLQTKLVLVHVDEFQGGLVTNPVLYESAILQKRRELEHEVRRLRDLGTDVGHKLLSGSPFDELVATAIESKAQLIVVGALGHGLARRLLVGSVAERTAETSPVPTLVIRPGGRLASWVRGEQTLKILIGYDFSPAGDAALQWLHEMQEIGPCEITVVHIDWPPEQAHRLGYHGPLPLTENPKEIQNFLERDLSERVAMILAPEKVNVVVEPGWGRTDGYLFEMASRENVDLVVVGTHRRQGWGRLRFGSVSRSILHHTTKSVAVIPPTKVRRHLTIPKLDRVLVATDFSELGNKAVPYGCAVLRRGGTLRLLHVIEPSEPAAARNKPRPGKDNPKLRSKLRALVPNGAVENFDLEEEIVESADAATAIAQEAERFDADAICLGSHGRTGLAKTVLGSVAQGVMAKNKRPVMVVREET